MSAENANLYSQIVSLNIALSQKEESLFRFREDKSRERRGRKTLKATQIEGLEQEVTLLRFSNNNLRLEIESLKEQMLLQEYTIKKLMGQHKLTLDSNKSFDENQSEVLTTKKRKEIKQTKGKLMIQKLTKNNTVDNFEFDSFHESCHEQQIGNESFVSKSKDPFQKKKPTVFEEDLDENNFTKSLDFGNLNFDDFMENKCDKSTQFSVHRNFHLTTKTTASQCESDYDGCSLHELLSQQKSSSKFKSLLKHAKNVCSLVKIKGGIVLSVLVAIISVVLRK